MSTVSLIDRLTFPGQGIVPVLVLGWSGHRPSSLPSNEPWEKGCITWPIECPPKNWPQIAEKVLNLHDIGTNHVLWEATVTSEKRGNKPAPAHVSENSQPACIQLLLILPSLQYQRRRYLKYLKYQQHWYKGACRGLGWCPQRPGLFKNVQTSPLASDGPSGTQRAGHWRSLTACKHSLLVEEGL